MLLSIGISSFIFINFLLLFFIVACSKRSKARSNEISQSLRTNNYNNNNNNSNKSLKFIPVKVEPPSREFSTSNRIKKNKKCASPAAAAKKDIKNQKVKSKMGAAGKKDVTKENLTSSDFVKQEIRTTGGPVTNLTKDLTLTCEMDGYQSERPTTTEETTVAQNVTTEQGGYDNLTVPSEKEKEKIDLS